MDDEILTAQFALDFSCPEDDPAWTRLEGLAGEAERLLIKRCAAAAYDAVGRPLGGQVSVSVLLTDDLGIQVINQEYRNIDRPTDVLSFPQYAFKSPCKLKRGEHPLPEPDTGRVALGDIILSVERARSQAEEYGHGVDRELGFLTVHSLLHLVGYDHETEKDRIPMRQQEEAILAALELMRE